MIPKQQQRNEKVKKNYIKDKTRGWFTNLHGYDVNKW